MLDEERIRIMTRMASYETGEGREDMPVKQYYRRDYVSYQMIRTFISSTISFGILFLFWGMYRMETIMEQLAKMDLIQFGISILIKYAIFVVIYQVIAVIVYNRKYTKATAGVKKYHADIKKIMKLQEKEEKLQLSED
ncbi:hypothetical protein [Roseburia sp. 499]|uniref:hypothetical protein n=1 Tax=Roseburia sp. 499 TaxID=1261634 RepID=UPI0009530148|nr:hypothetical protein [Roseburia sp. 499]WVK69330.1 hypothetical protein BIV20_13330 [Roseburia sp. 499]